MLFFFNRKESDHGIVRWKQTPNSAVEITQYPIARTLTFQAAKRIGYSRFSISAIHSTYILLSFKLALFWTFTVHNRLPTVLASPISWNLFCNRGYIFTNGLSYVSKGTLTMSHSTRLQLLSTAPTVLHPLCLLNCMLYSCTLPRLVTSLRCSPDFSWTTSSLYWYWENIPIVPKWQGIFTSVRLISY